MKNNVREVALDALIKLDQNQAYSNLLLQSAMKANDLSDKDRGLLTELVYGTLQNKLALDYMLKPFIKKPEKVKDWVIHLLRMSLYQMEYLEKIPDRAALLKPLKSLKDAGVKEYLHLLTVFCAPFRGKECLPLRILPIRLNALRLRQAIRSGLSENGRMPTGSKRQNKSAGFI